MVMLQSVVLVGHCNRAGIIETQVDINSTTGILSGSVRSGYLSDDGQNFCVADGEGIQTAFYTVSGNEISTIDGLVAGASGDLTNCLIVTSSGFGFIGVWDGGDNLSTSEPFDISTIESYNFPSTGGTSVELTDDGEVFVTDIIVNDGDVTVVSESFVIEGIPSFTGMSVNGNGTRISVSDGGGGETPDLFVFQISTENPASMADTDMDGVDDRDDEDDDNDGILDSEECPAAHDYSQTQFGPSNITILTSQGDEINISVGSMVTDDALFDIGFPNSFNVDRGPENVNEFKIDFPFEVKSLRITAIDFDADAFGDPTEWMDNFSVFPTEIIGDGNEVEDGFTFGSKEIQGRGIIPDSTNGSMVLYWNSLPEGTRSISWNNNRTTMDLDVNFQIDRICYDLDGDGIP